MGFYDKTFGKVDYRILALLPALVGLLLIPFAINIHLGMDFTGGTEVQILTERDISPGQYSSVLSSCSSEVDVNIRDLASKNSVIIRSKQEMTTDCVKSSLAGLGFLGEELDSITPSTYTADLGKTLLGQGANVFMIAVILVVIIVFISFRVLVPSVAILQAAFFDIVIALGVLSLFGFELNLAGVAAILMLIGYSVDTDIMLTSRVLKQSEKEFSDTIDRAFGTGMTMTGAALAAMGAIFITTLFVRMDTMAQISAVLLAGLTADIFTTWFTNVGMLHWYTSRNKSKVASKRFKFSIFRS